MADIIISDLPVITGVTGDDYIIINDGNVTTAISSFANVVASITDVGIVGFADGSAAQPSITFSADRNVGIYRPGPDEWAVATNATQRLVINAAGAVGIGNSTPGGWGQNLVVGSTTTGDNGIAIVSSPVDVGDITFSDGSNPNELAVGRIRYDHTNNHMEFTTSNVETLRITTDQELLIGTTVPIVGSKVVIDGGAISIPTGTSGVPSLNFATDTDTGVWSAAPDHVSIATGGVERVTIDDSGHFYLNADSDTYLYHSGSDEITFANQGSETLTLDSNNNVKLSGTLPTLYTNNNEMRLSVDADGDGPSSLLSVYLGGSEAGRFTTGGFSVSTTVNAGITTIGGSIVSGYPTLTLVRDNDESTTSDIQLTGASVIRSTSSIANVVNDAGTFTWGVGGTNAAAGLAGSTQVMSLDSTTLSVDAAITTNNTITFTGSSATGTFLSTPVADSLAISTGGTEQFRIADNGAIGLGGANYGTAGQVLSSNGPSAQPTWISLAAGVPDISNLPTLP